MLDANRPEFREGLRPCSFVEEALKANIDLMIEYAKTFLGLPYRWGGSNPMAGFDCSGLVLEILVAGGLWRDRQDATAQQIHNFLLQAKRQPILPRAGALSFYGRGHDAVTHIGFCINDDQMIEAGGGGAKTLTRQDAERQGAFVRIRPVQYRTDYLYCLLPFAEPISRSTIP